ncbi:MAG: S8 family serine peptidase [Rubrivivax sp.]|nr:S8 family serine peptidase [Rubrivivax sp.]
MSCMTTMRRLAAVCAVSLLAACGGGGEPTAEAPAALAAVPEQRALSTRSVPPLSVALNTDVVLMLKPGYPLQPLLRRYRLTLAEQFGQRPIYRLRAAPGTQLSVLVERLRGETSVRAAELNVAVANPESRRVSVWAVGESAQGYATQYAPGLINLDAALELTRGGGVRVAVLDTGADLEHPALAARWARDPLGRVLGRDFVDDDLVPAEGGTLGRVGFGHGTHVAGIVARTAPGARLMPVRVLDANGVGNAWVLAEALAWALDPDGDPSTDDGAHIINLSLSATTPTDLLKRVAEMATCESDDDDDFMQDAGFAADRARCDNGFAAVVLAAAGNGGSDQERTYPAAEEVKGTLAVTAHDAQRKLAGFANWGSWIGISAPGDRIVSTVPGGGYGTWSGTSMATPWVAGTAALLMSTRPASADPGKPPIRQWVPEEVVKRLKDRGGKLCATSFLGVDALAAVLDQASPDPACS